MKKRTTRRPTQSDIAERLGIHQTTVSAVLRGNAPIYVAEETRQRILEVAARIGYPLRNVAEPELPETREGGTVVGVLNFSTPIGAGAERLRQITRAVDDAGFRELVVDAGWSRDGGALACRALLDAEVRGVILSGVNDYFDLRQIVAFRKKRIPVAAISAAHLRGTVTLASDREAGFELLVHHLAGSGRKRLWLSTFPESRKGSIPSHDAQLSIADGFQKAIAECGLEKSCRILRGEDHPGAGYSHYDFGYRAMQNLLQAARKTRFPDAVLCFGDSWALGAMRACHEAGIRIPEDLALTGYGGEPFTAYTTPPLTTIATPFAKLARLAVEKIEAGWKSPTRSLRGFLKCSGNLEARASTA